MTSFGSFQRLFHLGFVVEDVPLAAGQLSQALGVRWTPVSRRQMRMAAPDGPRSVPMATCYTREGPVHLELIEAQPGTLWERAGGISTPHHVGVWADDLPAASADLAHQDLPLVATYAPGDPAPGCTVSGFAYHQLPDGTFLELLDAARKPAFDAWFAGGPFPGVPQQEG